ncbi:MAG: 4-hydroxy-tetrahydrodipicolinate synthase [Actinomycetota bacterium]
MVGFGQVITAMVTPFKDDLSVDYDAAQELANFLVENGSEGLVVTGTTGEASTLTMEESLELYKAVRSAVGERARVIAGSGSNSTHEAIHLTKEAEKAGVDVSLQVAPYYNKPSQQGFFHHFKSVAESTTLPLILYNIPGRTGKNVDADTIIALSRIENIVGVKEASGDLEQVARIVKETPDDFYMYSGEDFLTLPIVCLGGDGVISVASHLVGKEMQEMITAYKNGDVKGALDMHQKLMPLFKVLFVTSNPVPVKAALNLVGRKVGGVRSPLVPATEEEKEKISKVLRQMELIYA